MRAKRLRRLMHFALAHALVGLFVSAVLLRIHVFSEYRGAPGCGLGETTDCYRVARSEYSELLGWPLAAYSSLYFLAVLILLMAALRRAELQAPSLALVASLSALGLMEGLYLIGVQAFVIETWCLLCLALDVILLALVLAGWAAWPRRPNLLAAHAGRWARWAIVSRRGRWVAALIAGLLAAGIASGLALRRDRLRHQAEGVFVGRPVQVAWLENGPSRGPADASVTIVMFSDFQCGACARAAEVLDELLEEQSDLRLVHQDFPLDSMCNPALERTFHPLACWGALFADCAGAQGHYWEYHDLLFARQDALSEDQLKQIALDLPLELQRFESCINDQAVQRGLTQRVGRAVQLNIQRTPTLFINGFRVEGNPGLDALRAIAELARQRARQQPA